MGAEAVADINIRWLEWWIHLKDILREAEDGLVSVDQVILANTEDADISTAAVLLQGIIFLGEGTHLLLEGRNLTVPIL